jgi:ABC-type transport system involved in multi-copper enzyme maturation permease subunit
MLTSYWDSLKESLGRRVALVLFGLSIVSSVAFNLLIKVETRPDGHFRVLLGNRPLAADNPAAAVAGVHSVVAQQMGIAGGLWILGAIFAAAPLFASVLDKGWLELLFAKGTPRWRIFLGRYLAGATLYASMFALTTFPLAVRMWWKTDVRVWQVSVALLFYTLSFISVLSVAAYASLSQRGAALPILAAVAIWSFSPMLVERERTFFTLINRQWIKEIFNWAYRILPKCSELGDMAGKFMKDGQIATWWPVWSTGVFAVAVLAATLWSVERKSF